MIWYFLVWLIGLAVSSEFGRYFERKSWEKQSNYDTPKYSGGEFYFVEKETERFKKL